MPRAEPRLLSSIGARPAPTGRLWNLQVANDTQLSENGTCEVRLACSVETPADNVSIRWQVSGSTPSEGANLSTSWDPASSGEQTYTCVAENPVSYLASSLSTRSLCPGNGASGARRSLVAHRAAARWVVGTDSLWGPVPVAPLPTSPGRQNRVPPTLWLHPPKGCP